MTALDPKALDAAVKAYCLERSRQGALFLAGDAPIRDNKAVDLRLNEALKAFLSALNRDDVVERCKDAVQTYSWSTDGSGSFVFRGDDPNSEAIERFENRVDAFDRAQELNARAVLAELGIGEG